MSTFHHDHLGGPTRFTTHSLKSILSSEPKHEAILEHFLDAGKTLRAVCEEDVNHRVFALLVAASIAAGTGLGIYQSCGPRKVFLLWGAGHFESDWHRLKLISRMPEFDAAQALLERNLQIYHRDHENDPPIDLGDSTTQTAMTKTMAQDTEVMIVDWVPSLMRKRSGRLHPIPPFPWFKELNAKGIAVVAFDEWRKADGEPKTEATAAATAYLRPDPSAPSQFGGGFLIERGRVGDADHAARNCSFWHTEIGGELDFGFYLPDPADEDRPSEVKKRERDIKFEVMLASNMKLVDIAEEFKVHKSTITRWKQELEREKEAAERAALLDPNSPNNRWDAVEPLGRLLRVGRRQVEERDEREQGKLQSSQCNHATAQQQPDEEADACEGGGAL